MQFILKVKVRSYFKQAVNRLQATINFLYINSNKFN
jgi:hypothetical protein